MKQEDKDLLLKDLSARLPYGTKVRRYRYTTPIDSIQSVELLGLEWLKELYEEEAEFKPYLFPLSSMTEEQKKEFNSYFASVPYYGDNIHIPYYSIELLIDFYNKHHLDWRGLIEKSLALDATGKNIY